jgi:hypothetical protein
MNHRCLEIESFRRHIVIEIPWLSEIDVNFSIFDRPVAIFAGENFVLHDTRGKTKEIIAHIEISADR